MGLAVSFTSCSSDNDSPLAPVDPVDPTPELPVVNKTMAELVALAGAETAFGITEDVIFEGVVISNDLESDNFYTKLYIQNGDLGVLMSVAKADSGDSFYKDFTIGQKVIVNANGLHIGLASGAVILGQGADDKYTVGRIADKDLRNMLFKAKGGADVTPKTLKLSEITDAHLNTLVKIEGVQFVEGDLAKNYGQDQKEDGSFWSNANRTLTNSEGETIIVRSSQYAEFAETTVAQGSGTITAIISKYNDDYQLYIRDINEVAMTESRFDIVEPVIPFVDKTVDTMDETFADAAYGEKISLEGWFSEATEGTSLWLGKEYSSNQYMQASAYDTGLDAATSWIVTPGLNLDAADSKKNFSFDSKRGKSNGEVLEVYVSADFDFNTGVTAATWVKQTVTLAAANANGYSAAWVNSGVIDLSSYSGTVHVAFKYVGNATTATGTYQIDNVKFNFTPQEPVEVVPSYNFENWTDGLPDGWTFTRNKGEAVTKVTDKKEGDYAMKVALDSREDFNILFDTENNNTYKVSFWYKMEGTPGSNGIKLWCKVGDEYADATLKDKKLDVQTEWTLYEATFESVTTDSFKFEVRGYNATDLVFYIDDVKVEKQ